jgi:hypothetical protein
VLTRLAKILPILDPPEKGAYTQLFAVASESFIQNMNGSYLVPVAQVSKTSKRGEDAQLATDLWEWTGKEMELRGFN